MTTTTSHSDYRDGGDGFIAWAEDNVRFPIYPEGSDVPIWFQLSDLPEKPNPETGRSYKSMWYEQKEIIREALQMRNGRFKHRLIVFCWQRGEGKSLIACVIQLWKFFNFPRQNIVCGANSKDQVKFVHYDIMRGIIENSPKLLSKVGQKNIKEKNIAFKDSAGHIQSTIQCISSFTGIVSNITGYTFSEFFDMKNPRFFVQLDGSIRNIPNALGVIDSTVSEKTHMLYDKLFLTYMNRKDPALFFHYRYSKEGKQSDFWNPQMTQAQLDSYREKFPLGEFERYFLNLWSAGSARLFTPEMIEATHYIGLDHKVGPHKEIIAIIKEKNNFIENASGITSKMDVDIDPIISSRMRRLWPMTDVFKLKVGDSSRLIEILDLEKLSNIYDTDWAVIGSLDRADPLKVRTSARTIVSFIAKGLIGSRTNPFIQFQDTENKDNPPYIYILIHLADIPSHSLESIKNEISLINEICEVDKFGSERWGAWDLEPWCTERNIPIELWQPTYDKQKVIFTEVYLAYHQGRFKTPPIAIKGSKTDDILDEEASAFDHDPDVKLFGSVEKKQKGGIQDDAMYAIGGAIYAGRELSVMNFRTRKGKINFGIFIKPDTTPLGVYT